MNSAKKISKNWKNYRAQWQSLNIKKITSQASIKSSFSFPVPHIFGNFSLLLSYSAVSNDKIEKKN